MGRWTGGRAVPSLCCVWGGCALCVDAVRRKGREKMVGRVVVMMQTERGAATSAEKNLMDLCFDPRTYVTLWVDGYGALWWENPTRGLALFYVSTSLCPLCARGFRTQGTHGTAGCGQREREREREEPRDFPTMNQERSELNPSTHFTRPCGFSFCFIFFGSLLLFVRLTRSVSFLSPGGHNPPKKCLVAKTPLIKMAFYLS